MAVETLQNSNLSSESVKFVYNKVTLFSLSKFQYISDSLHSCTNRQNIQSHCFNCLVPRPSRNYCFKNPQKKPQSGVLSVPHQVNARQGVVTPIGTILKAATGDTTKLPGHGGFFLVGQSHEGFKTAQNGHRVKSKQLQA